MSPSSSRTWLALILAATTGLTAAASGCMGPMQRREDGLTRAAVEFNNELRWGRYEQVARFLSPDESQALLLRKRDLGEDFVIADNEMTLVQFVPGSEKATVITEIAWYNQRRALMNKSTIEQRWEWTDGRWLLATQRRVHGVRFPLVPEPLTKSESKSETARP